MSELQMQDINTITDIPVAEPAMDSEKTIVEKLTERKVNHCAYGLLTFFTGGIGGVFWVGACLGYCPPCL